MAARLNPIAEGTVWIYVFLFWLIALIFLFFTPTAANFTHSFQLSNPPGTLVSRRWTFEFFVVGLYVLLWTIPITAAFAISDPEAKTQWRPAFHTGVTIVLLLWLVAVFLVGCLDWANANKTDPSNYHNRANDKRWCCVYFNLPDTPCVNTVACSPGVAAAELTTDPEFLFQLWFTFVFIVILFIDLIIFGCVVNPAIRRVQEEANSTAMTEPLMPEPEGRRIGTRYQRKPGNYRV